MYEWLIQRKNLILWEFEVVYMYTAQADKATDLFVEMRYSDGWMDPRSMGVWDMCTTQTNKVSAFFELEARGDNTS